MLIDAMKSAGPKMMVSIRGEAAAMASTLTRPAGVLDLRLDADPTDRQTDRLLHLGQREVKPGDLLGGLHLGQHDAVEVRPGALDDLDHVAVRPRAW